MNKAVMMGRLVKDPEVRYVNTKKGEMPIANFRIAVNRRFVKEDGVDTDFFSCSAFGRASTTLPIAKAGCQEPAAKSIAPRAQP